MSNTIPIRLKGIIDEDFVNYKKASMVLMFPTCTFKCDKECGKPVCQNSALAKTADVITTTEWLVERYMSNPITKAIVFQGLEPLDSDAIYPLMEVFRIFTNDPIIIYTGYTEEELRDVIPTVEVIGWKNIIMKFGRFVPGQKPHIDRVLGVPLASDNQYAKKIC